MKTSKASNEIILTKKVDYHPYNGVSGEGFYIVLFEWKETQSINRQMVGILFGESGQCAILDTKETDNGNIEFARGNSWRGDRFESQLRQAVKAWRENDYKV